MWGARAGQDRASRAGGGGNVGGWGQGTAPAASHLVVAGTADWKVLSTSGSLQPDSERHVQRRWLAIECAHQHGGDGGQQDDGEGDTQDAGPCRQHHRSWVAVPGLHQCRPKGAGCRCSCRWRCCGCRCRRNPALLPAHRSLRQPGSPWPDSRQGSELRLPLRLLLFSSKAAGG